MLVLEKVDSHDDERRTLIAFRPPDIFPKVVEGKMLVVKNDGVSLGKHSHPHNEGFFLAAGACNIKTWTAEHGVQEKYLVAPIMFMFEPNEEHLLICAKGTIIIGYMPVIFGNENNAPAVHL